MSVEWGTRRPHSWLLHEFFDLAFDGGGPHVVAFDVEVEEVRHDFFGQCAIGLEEGVADVHEVDAFAVCAASEEIVRGEVLLAHFVLLGGTTREDSEEQYFGFRIIFRWC